MAAQMLRALACLVLLLATLACAAACPYQGKAADVDAELFRRIHGRELLAGSGKGNGTGSGNGSGGNGAADPGLTAEEQGVVQFLFSNHKQIKRSVTKLSKGVKATTYSKNATVAQMIRDHVAQMWHKVEGCALSPASCSVPRKWDPLFPALFAAADKMSVKITNTSQGVTVQESSSSKTGAKLIKAHADVVSGFVKYGQAEAQKAHPVPSRR